eukprot:SAG31_NODE_1103_length_9895_cov_13.722540_4_plen_444_part_00
MAAQEVEGVMVPVEATATAVATAGASVPSLQGPTVPPKAELMALFKATTLRVREDQKDLQIAEDQRLTARTADEKELHAFNVEFALETLTNNKRRLAQLREQLYATPSRTSSVPVSPDTVEGSPEKQQPQSTVASQMDGNRNDQAKPPPCNTPLGVDPTANVEQATELPTIACQSPIPGTDDSWRTVASSEISTPGEKPKELAAAEPDLSRELELATDPKLNPDAVRDRQKVEHEGETLNRDHAGEDQGQDVSVKELTIAIAVDLVIRQIDSGRMLLIQHGEMRSATLLSLQTEVTLRTGKFHQVCIATSQTYSDVDSLLTDIGLAREPGSLVTQIADRMGCRIAEWNDGGMVMRPLLYVTIQDIGRRTITLPGVPKHCLDVRVHPRPLWLGLTDDVKQLRYEGDVHRELAHLQQYHGDNTPVPRRKTKKNSLLDTYRAGAST